MSLFASPRHYVPAESLTKTSCFFLFGRVRWNAGAESFECNPAYFYLLGSEVNTDFMTAESLTKTSCFFLFGRVRWDAGSETFESTSPYFYLLGSEVNADFSYIFEKDVGCGIAHKNILLFSLLKVVENVEVQTHNDNLKGGGGMPLDNQLSVWENLIGSPEFWKVIRGPAHQELMTAHWYRFVDKLEQRVKLNLISKYGYISAHATIDLAEWLNVDKVLVEGTLFPPRDPLGIRDGSVTTHYTMVYDLKLRLGTLSVA